MHPKISLSQAKSNITTKNCFFESSLGCQLPQELRFSRRSSNSWRMALGIRERGSCLCGQLTHHHRELDKGQEIEKGREKESLS